MRDFPRIRGTVLMWDFSFDCAFGLAKPVWKVRYVGFSDEFCKAGHINLTYSEGLYHLNLRYYW